MQHSQHSFDRPKEGKLTKKVEEVTTKIPSMAYVGLAAGSLLLSAGLAAFGRKQTRANFVGLWVPTLLLLGIYNKLLETFNQLFEGFVILFDNSNDALIIHQRLAETFDSFGDSAQFFHHVFSFY